MSERDIIAYRMYKEREIGPFGACEMSQLRAANNPTNSQSTRKVLAQNEH